MWFVVELYSKSPNPAFERDSPRSGRAPQLYVRRYANHAKLYVLRDVERAVVFIACSVFVASRFVVELFVSHVHLFSRAVSFSVSRSSMLRSLLYNASPVFSCGCFSPFYLQYSVAKSASNPSLKRDAAEARRPLAPR